MSIASFFKNRFRCNMKKKITSSCTGCGCCHLVCPVKCIKMVSNKHGHLEPSIEFDKCIKCNLCLNRCPQNQNAYFNYPKACYAACSMEKVDLLYSASGGVTTVFSRFVYNHCGSVYGCDYDELGNLLYIKVNSEKDLNRLQSSKYTRADAFMCFEDIKSDLHNCEKQVLFIGLPCQVSGLKSYLNKDYANLLTIDLVCHGTPPNKYLKQHLSEQKVQPLYEQIRFRGEFDQKLTVKKGGKICYHSDKSEDIFFSAFYDNMISYDSCYTCKYAQSERVSDITVADFWGLGDSIIKKRTDRPSLILVNSEKGLSFFEESRSLLMLDRREIAEGIRGNGRLNCPPGKNELAKLFQFKYSMEPNRFDKAALFAYKVGKMVRIPKQIKKKVWFLGFLIKRLMIKIINLKNANKK